MLQGVSSSREQADTSCPRPLVPGALEALWCCKETVGSGATTCAPVLAVTLLTCCVILGNPPP